MVRINKTNRHNALNDMTNYWCESCSKRWQGDDNDLTCPDCKSDEVRKTMSREEAEKLGLTEE
jgi:Zn finger protein HypA/HybF involved in hydrogenase expression